MGSPTTVKKFREAAVFFSALAEPYRQDIILLLAETEEMNVREIAGQIDLSRPAVSHHLKVLRQCGLVEAQKRGTENYYTLTLKEPLNQLKAFIKDIEEDCVIR